MARFTDANVALAQRDHRRATRGPKSALDPAAAPRPGAGRLRHRRRDGAHRRALGVTPAEVLRHVPASTRCSSSSRSASTSSTSAPTSSCQLIGGDELLAPRRGAASASRPAAPPPTACSRSRTSSASRRAPRRRACRSTTATATGSRTTTFDQLIDDLRAGRLDDEIPPHGTLARVRQRIPADRRRRHRRRPSDGRRRRCGSRTTTAAAEAA